MTGTLKIINVNHSDAGNITCEAHDIYSKISETSAFFVYGTFSFVLYIIFHYLYQKPASLNDIFEDVDSLCHWKAVENAMGKTCSKLTIKTLFPYAASVQC